MFGAAQSNQLVMIFLKHFILLMSKLRPKEDHPVPYDKKKKLRKHPFSYASKEPLRPLTPTKADGVDLYLQLLLHLTHLTLLCQLTDPASQYKLHLALASTWNAICPNV